jgi:subtilisin family serine protease
MTTGRKEYLVAVNNPADFDQLHEELITDYTRGHLLAAKLNGSSSVPDTIPERPVELLDYREANLRTAHYSLTDEEAATLATDPRIQFVEKHYKLMDGVDMHTTALRSGLYDKGYTTVNTHRNWGLKSSTSTTNPYSNSSATQLDSTYPYTLTGRNVDVVIIDTGIKPDHPEFAVNADGTGGSRVKQINWFLETGVSGSMPPNHYSDNNGHGSHVAGIAAGNTCGWAKDANIYSIKVLGDTYVIDPYTAFDLLRVWHLNKPVNPATGRKNPTIVNCSWTFQYATSGAITLMHYRGNNYTSVNFSPTERAAKGLVNLVSMGIDGKGVNFHAVRVNSIDSQIQDCLNAGIIIVAAAGNFAHKVDVPGGVDYDNYYYDSRTGNYYHRGGTPGSSPGVITVGNVDNSYPEQKSTSSECGPRVNVWAPGSYIMSAYTSDYNIRDSRNSNYYLAKLSGTSMASPQVTGALALALEFKPWMTYTQAATLLTNKLSVDSRLTSLGIQTSYTNSRALQGAPNKFLYVPFTGNGTGNTYTTTLR